MYKVLTFYILIPNCVCATLIKIIAAKRKQTLFER